MALTQVKSDGIATGAVTATQIAANAVTVDDIADGSISTAKLADDAVTADKLADTAVTAGSYGSASAIPAITVDAQGRITSASTNAISVESDRIFEGNTSAEAVDTGSDGHFKVVTEGTEAFRIDASQDYLFKASNPVLKLFNSTNETATLINDNGGGTSIRLASNSLIFADDGNNEKARINSGRLLVGTSTARSNVNSAAPNFQIETATTVATAAASLSVINNQGAGASTAAINLGLTRGTSLGGTTKVESTDELGYINFVGSDGTNFIPGARIFCTVDATTGTNDMPGRLVFATTADGGSSPSERMRITSTGQLLCGTTTTNAAVRAFFSGDNWGGGTGSNTGTGSSLPQFIFDRCGLDNSGSVTPIGFNIRGGGGGVPRGLCFAAHGAYQGNSATNHNVFFVRNVGNTGQTWNTVNGTPGAGVQAGPADAYAGPHASGWWSPSFAAQFGIKDVTTGTYDGGRKVGQTIELGGTYGGGSPGNWGGYCLALRIATNFGSGSSGTNYGLYADISGAGSGNNWGVWINNGGAAKPGGGSWSSTSDGRVKTVNSSYTRGLTEIAQLNPVNFSYNGKAETTADGKEYIGLIAQEVQPILPDMVTSRSAKLEETDEEETDILMVDPSELVYTLINACKELKTQVDDLTARLTALETP